METNNLMELARESKLDTFVSFDWLTGMNLLGVMFVLTLAVGYLLRRVERIPNTAMWVLIPVVAVLYGWLGTRPGSDPRAYALNGVFGTVAATLAVLAVVLAHDRLLRFAATRWPWLGFLVASGEGKQQQKENAHDKNDPHVSNGG